MRKKTQSKRLAIVVPTYQRTELLALLITDIRAQSLQPDLVVVVDGKPNSGNVTRLLSGMVPAPDWKLIYIPSCHANAPFQRFVGSQAASGYEIVMFVDDDMRFPENDSFEKLVAPFAWQDRFVVGVSPNIDFPARKQGKSQSFRWKFVGFMRSSAKLFPGELTPVGDRIPVLPDKAYASSQWLRGGVMVYRGSALGEFAYRDDVFALSHIRCGLGADDTYFSRYVGLDGELLIANCVTAIHPDADTSKAYPYDKYRLAYARAFSRRFLNDHYRLNMPAQFSDRLALIRSYVWNFMVNWLKALVYFSPEDLAYAWGYTLGALYGLVLRPTSNVLTSDINWQFDLEEALAQQVVLK